MVIYIHGFGGSGEGSKAKIFREYFQSINEKFIAPSLSYVPELAIKTLEELIESYDGKVSLIGSSLGGYYSLYLSQKYDTKVALINPAINPEITLKRALGYAANFYDDSSFKWSEKHIDMLVNYRTNVKDQNKILLLLQKGDDLLDYTEAVKYLPYSSIKIEEGGSHSFDGIERYLGDIKLFLL